MHVIARAIHHKAQLGTLQPLSPAQKRLLAWAEAKGVHWPKALFPVKFHPGYIGLQAKQTISPNETIISVPRRLVITAQRVENSELGPLFASTPSLFKATKHSYADDFKLILFLLYEAEKGIESDWHVYLQTLPLDPPQVVYWPAESLSQLQDESLTREAMSQFRLLKAYWRQIRETVLSHPKLFTPEMVTWDKFKWAEGVVSSRAFGDGRMSHSLCPVAEFLNHHNNATGYVFERKGLARSGKPYREDDDDLPKGLFFPAFPHFAILLNSLYPLTTEQRTHLFISTNELDPEPEKTTKTPKTSTEDSDCLRIVAGPDETYEAGAEICLNYGPLSNRAALLRYGFAMANDDLAYCLVTLDVREYLTGDQYETIKKKQLRTDWTFKLKAGQICPKLLTALRLLLWRPNNHTLESIFSPEDISLDNSAKLAAINLLERTLSAFPTSISEDQQGLSSAFFLHEHFSLLYRFQRKSILSKHISSLRSSLFLVI